MRLIGRTASERLSGVTEGRHVLELGEDPSFPVKAKADVLLGGVGGSKPQSKSHRVLGEQPPKTTSTTAPTTTTGKKLRKAESFAHLPSPPEQQQRDRGDWMRAQGAVRDTQEALLQTNMSYHVGRRGDSHRANSSTLTPTINDFHHNEEQFALRRPGIPPRKTSSRAFVDEYYDPSREPLYVSQQTSASAVRDRALRKGPSMTIHETHSDPMLSRQPIKSAMKKSPPSKLKSDDGAKARPDSREKKPQKLDISRLFPQPRPSTGKALLSPTKLTRSPSAMTDASDFFPKETVQVQLKKQKGSTRFESQKIVDDPPVNANIHQRVKVFDSDIFDNAKTNVRRPPKGIQNWFDGFDISSDEEEIESEPEPAPIPAPVHTSAPAPQELPANETPARREKQPVFTTPWLKPEHEQPVLMRKPSVDPMEENLLFIEQAKNRLQERWHAVGQRKGSTDSGADSSIVSSDAPGKRRGGESRLAHSRLATESVLSLSGSSGDDADDADEADQLTLDSIDDRATHVRSIASSTYQPSVYQPSSAPSMPSKPVQIPRSGPKTITPRMSTSTVRTSGSIPIRLTDSIPLPDLSTLPSPPKRPSQIGHRDPTAQALRKLNGLRESTSQATQSRRTTQASVPYTEGSAGADTATNLSNDAAHIMAVTEEEMILLEMMRSKRAAMQKNSFAEGYQLALQREQEHIVRRREAAQKSAYKMLRDQEERSIRGGRDSRMGSVAEEELDPYAQQRKRYSVLHKEDVDKSLKLERFLSDAQSPLGDSYGFPEPPIGSPIDEPKAPQKFELLLPTTYSPSSSKPQLASPPFADVDNDSSALPEDDIEDHHSRIRQFLASSSASDSASLFPTPPSAKSRTDRWESHRGRSHKGVLSPSPVAEEEPILPDLPEHSPIRLPHSYDQSRERRRSISGRRLSGQTSVDPLAEPSVASFTMLPRSSTTSLAQSQNNHYHPNNSYQLLSAPPTADPAAINADLPGRLCTASPSLSTSRASPLTPTFLGGFATEKATSSILAPDIAGSENASLRGRGAYTPDTDPTSLSASMGPTPSKKQHQQQSIPSVPPTPAVYIPTTSRKLSSRQEQPLAPTAHHSFTNASSKKENRDSNATSGGMTARYSTASMASAGEDVLAAWAELGGGSEGLLSRRKRHR